MLFVDERDRRNEADESARRLLPRVPAGFLERYRLDRDVVVAEGLSISEAAAFHDRYEAARDIYFKKTGKGIPNPYNANPSLRAEIQDFTDAALHEARAEHPDIPDPDAFLDEIAEERRILRERAEVAAAVSTFGGDVGGFVGTAAGVMRDPAVLGSMLFGAPAASGLARTALTEGAIGMASEAMIQPGVQRFKAKIGAPHGFGEALEQIGAAGLGGLVLGGGIKSLAIAFRKAFPKPTRRQQDALNVMERIDELMAETPFDEDDLGAADVHVRAYDDALDAAREGRPTRAGKIADEVPGEPRQVRGEPAGQGEAAPAAKIMIGGRELTIEQTRILSRAEQLEDRPFLVFDPREEAGFEGIFATAEEAEAFIKAQGEAGELLDFATPRELEELNPSGPESEAFMLQRLREILDDARTANRNIPEERAANLASTPATPQGVAPAVAVRSARPVVSKAFTGTGREIETTLEVVESSTLATSHRDDLSVNPDFPADLQPRDRARAASQAQITGMAGDLKPELLGPSARASDGAPIVGPDGVVESGNARVLAVRRAYKQKGKSAADYRAWLESQGFDTTGMVAPMLVRRRRTDLDPGQRRAFTREANERETLELSTTERAMSDAAALDDDLLGLYRGGDIGAVGNRPFVRAFVESIVAPAERAGMVTARGDLSQDGLRRVQTALLARAYDDPDLLAVLTESQDNNIRAIGGAMLDVAAPWAKMRTRARAGEIVRTMDATGDLLSAVNIVRESRRKGVKLSDAVSQDDLLGGGLSPTARLMLAMMFRDEALSRPVSRSRLADDLLGYIEEAEKNVAGARLFGEDIPDIEAGDILSARIRQRDDSLGLESPAERIIDDAAPGRASGAAAAREQADLAAGADTDAALFAEVERVLDENPDMAVPVEVVGEGGEITARTRTARELVDQADDDLKAAREVADCAGKKLKP